jgi:anaerobic magnesium-protoporphyrin IX monomethyl ester cyclase
MGGRMKVGIYNVMLRSRINKDCMGGFGLGFGNHLGLFGKIIGAFKKRNVYIPDIDLGYLAAIHRDQGDEVEYTETGEGSYDKVYIHTSLQGHVDELRAAEKLRARGIHVCLVGPVPKFLPDRFLGFDILTEKIWPKDKFPAWEYWPMERFSYFPSLKVRPVIPILSSTGCKYNCSYCPYLSCYGKWEGRSPENVLSEIEYMVKRFGVKGIIFRDPLFTADRNRAVEICRGIKGVDWACETRMENIDEPLIGIMAKSGCRAIHFGIESVNDTILSMANRSNPSYEIQKRLLDCCDEHGIKVNCFFIFGLLGETEETAQDTIETAIRLNPNVAEFFIAQPYPGTEFYRQVEDMLFGLPITAYDGFTQLFEHPDLPNGRLAQICTNAYRKFYFRPDYLWSFLKRNIK